MVKFLTVKLKNKILIINPQDKSYYRMPTKVYFGRGAMHLLSKIIKENKLSKVLFVAGEHFKRSDEFNLVYQKQNDTIMYDSAIKKSDFETINKLTKFCRTNKIDGIIAIGGGTILDTAKCASTISINKGLIEDYLITKQQEVSQKGLFFIAIPTTSGTGSEVTPWATIWEGGKKYSLDSKYMFPDVAIVDPALTDSLPQNLTAEPGIDALCQSIEAYWSIYSNHISDKYALESIDVILKNLSQAVNNPNRKLRDCMAWGSLLGGLAFSNTRTTICHSVSYPMTIHWGIPHGQAVAVTMPSFIEYTFPVLSKGKLSKILDVMQVKSPKEAAKKVRKLMVGIGLKTKLSELGIPKENIDLIVKEGFDPSRAKNSPKIPSPVELKEMLYRIL